jgi:KRAB domain-containing zinc finger protein
MPQKQFKCDFVSDEGVKCNKSFTQKANMKRHKETHNKNRETYDCHLCGKKLSSKSNLKRHINCHSNTVMYRCEVCDKEFNNKGRLLYHKNAHKIKRA